MPTSPVEKRIVKTYDIDKTGKVHVFRDMLLKNVSDYVFDLDIVEFLERNENVDLVNLRVEDEPKTNLLTFKKNVTGTYSEIIINSAKQLSPNEEYKIKEEYDLPNYAVNLDDSFIVKEIFQRTLGDEQKADEFHVIYKLPKLFSRYILWRKLHLVASGPATIREENGRRILEYVFNLKTDSSKHITFVYRAEKREIFYGILVFVAGLFAEKIVNFILGLF